MTEEEITTPGQFGSLGSADFADSYQSSSAGSSSIGASSSASTQSSLSTAAGASQQAGSAAATTRSPTVASAQETQAAIDKANANLASSNRVVDFRVDASTGLTIATIRNSQTGAVLQQIPGADTVALAKILADWSPGKHMLLDLIA
jgi:uncharacterized FlaG/YvyC family protein